MGQPYELVYENDKTRVEYLMKTGQVDTAGAIQIGLNEVSVSLLVWVFIMGDKRKLN